jgi:hypothetical protein
VGMFAPEGYGARFEVGDQVQDPAWNRALHFGS